MVTQDTAQEDPDSKEKEQLKEIKVDQETLVRPYLESPDSAEDWLEYEIGIPTVKPPRDLELTLPDNLEELKNTVLGGHLLRLATIKAYLREVVASMKSRVDARKQALELVRKEIKFQLGSTSTKTNLAVDRNRQVVKAHQSYIRFKHRYEKVETAYKSAGDLYKAASRVVELRLNEDEDSRRQNYVENVRRGRAYNDTSPHNSGTPGLRTNRKADRVARNASRKATEIDWEKLAPGQGKGTTND